MGRVGTALVPTFRKDNMTRFIPLAVFALACGEPAEEIAPPERTLEEAGIEEASSAPNILSVPPVDHFVFQPQAGAMGRGTLLKPGSKGVIRSEILYCDKDTLACDTSVGFYKDGKRLTLEEAQALGLPVEPPRVGEVHGELPNYWATSQISSVAGGASSGRGDSSHVTPPGNATAGSCIAGPDFCAVGFTPWCNGGAGKLSPGGIAETATGCRGSSIKHGGFRAIRPDNANQRVTFWGSTQNSCSDTDFTTAPELDYVVDVLNNNDRVLPPPFQLTRVGCGPNGLPPGFINGLCSSGALCIVPGNRTTDGTLADVVFSYASLQSNALDIQDYCTEALNAGPGFNRANAVTMGCSQELLEEDAAGIPVIRNWNNGYAPNTYYWTARGYYVTLDQIALNWWATRPANALDRGGLNYATRMWYLSIHVASHELGHTLGLTHPYEGDGSPRWVTHSHLPNSMSPNPNMIPYSVMARGVPAAPWTLNSWSSGLAADLQTYDEATAGAGNAEAWRMSNAFRTVNDGFTTFAKNTFWPPQSDTTNEL